MRKRPFIGGPFDGHEAPRPPGRGRRACPKGLPKEQQTEPEPWARFAIYLYSHKRKVWNYVKTAKARTEKEALAIMNEVCP